MTMIRTVLFITISLVVFMGLSFSTPRNLREFKNDLLAQKIVSPDVAISCVVCHVKVPHLNVFGKAYKNNKKQADKEFLDLDSDQDGYTNYIEVVQGTFPGHSDSYPQNVTKDRKEIESKK